MRTVTRLAAAAASAIAIAVPQLAQAELPFGTLSFVTPNGTAFTDESMEVWVRFTLDPGSVPLNFSSNPLTGFSPEDLPSFSVYTGAYLNTYIGCGAGDTFPCETGLNHNFNFWDTSTPGKPSLVAVDAFSLAPGASTDFLFGTFDPVPDGATPGTYTFTLAGLELRVTGSDIDGNALEARLIDFGTTANCGLPDTDCSFTRVVTVVPEPGTWALMALGVAALVARRRLR